MSETKRPVGRPKSTSPLHPANKSVYLFRINHLIKTCEELLGPAVLEHFGRHSQAWRNMNTIYRSAQVVRDAIIDCPTDNSIELPISNEQDIYDLYVDANKLD